MEYIVSNKGTENHRHAPIALFVYNRVDHLRKTIEALQANSEVSSSPLYIFSDAPKNLSELKAVNEVRQYIKNIGGFSSVHIIERVENYGLAKSIIDGVSALCEQYGRVIVMEDDLVTSPYFLKYMNEGLEKYQDEQRVISIHGYVYPVKQVLAETFFLKGADCWGWATWKRGWDLFEPDGQKLLNDLKRRKLCRQFDFDGSYSYTRMLQNQIAGKNNSWAIRWYASAFLQDKLTLYPGRSLVHNIGLDGSGTHCSETEGYAGKLAKYPISVESVAVVEDSLARLASVNFHKQTRSSLHMKIANKLLAKIQKLRTIWHDKTI